MGSGGEKTDGGGINRGRSEKMGGDCENQAVVTG